MSNRLLGEALKQTRRQFYVHGANWRPLVIAKTPAMMKEGFKEAKQILEASSMPVTGAEYQFADKPWIKLGDDKAIRFTVIGDMRHADMNTGVPYTHLIWLYEPDDQRLRDRMRAWLRSHVLDADQLIDEKVDW